MSDDTKVLELMGRVKIADAAYAEAKKVHDAARKKIEDLSAMQRDATRQVIEKFQPLHREAHESHQAALNDLRAKTAAAEEANDALLAATKS